jgi:hypothetical protein
VTRPSFAKSGSARSDSSLEAEQRAAKYCKRGDPDGTRIDRRDAS